MYHVYVRRLLPIECGGRQVTRIISYCKKEDTGVQQQRRVTKPHKKKKTRLHISSLRARHVRLPTGRRTKQRQTD